MEAGHPSTAIAAYRSASSSFGDALATGADVREKAVANFALGRTHERLSALVVPESEAWNAKARGEYADAASQACGSDAADLKDLCATAREQQDGMKL